MAQAIGNFIDRIQIGNDEAHQIAIGSSAYGVCDTIANEAAKTVNIPGFSLNTGTTIHVKFTYSNTANNPTLNVSSTGAKSIKQYGTTAAGTDADTSGWQSGAVLTLTYDGTNWIRDQGYNTNTEGAYGNIGTDGKLDEASQAVVTDSNKLITTANLSVSDPSIPSSGTNTSLSFIDTISQNAQGKISVTKKNVQTVSASKAGVAPKGESVTTQNQSTKFLRSDGTWATPSYTVNTDAAVTQTITSDNNDYRILFSGTADDTTHTEGTRKDGDLTYNPSTNTLNIGTGTLTGTSYSGKATTAGTADSANNVAWANTNHPDTFPPSTHTHGNIQNDGTLSTASYAVVTDANKKITVEDLHVDDPNVVDNATSTSFISNIATNTKGKITTLTKKNLPTASTTVAGITKVGASGGAAAYSHNHDSTYAAKSHTHGNIQDDGKLQTTDVAIADGDKLVITDASDSNKVARASISFDGTTATQALTKKGTWETFNNYSLPLAANGTRGGIQIGYTTSATDHNYAVQLSSEKAYVNVPWTDTNNAVTQSGNSENKEFAILLKNTNNSTDETAAVKYVNASGKEVTINPSTGKITAPGGLAGNATNITGILALANLTKGDANTALMGQGSSLAPEYVSVSPSITITAGTSSAAPKVNVTVLGVSGTAKSITTATTTKYGVTKLSAAADNSGLAATAKSVYDLDVKVDGLLAAADAMVFKGTVGTGGTVTSLPTTHNAGWTYRVITDGIYKGTYCEEGTLIICVQDRTTAIEDDSLDWTFVETNEDGAVIGPESSTDDHIVTFDGTSGRIIQDSGFTIQTSVPENAVFTDENVSVEANTATKFYLTGSSTSTTATGTLLKSADLYYTSNNTSGKRESELIIGNTKATSSSGGRYGVLSLYSRGTKGTSLIATTNSNAWQTVRLPAKTGTLVVLEDANDAPITTTTNGIAIYADTTGTLTDSSATIDSSGNITAPNFIGDLTGNADTATLADKAIAANLESTTANAVAYYSDTAATFDAIASNDGALYATAENGQLHWGTLPVLQGGTGVIDFTDNCIITSKTTSGTQTLDSRGLTVTGAIDASTITISTYTTNSNIAINANGSGKIDLTSTSGNTTIQSSTGQMAVKSTTGKLEVSSNYGSLIIQGGSKKSTTYSTLTLGNATARTAANQSEGKIILYSSSTAAHTIIGYATSTAYTHTLPKHTGWLASGASDGVADDTTLMYLANTGVLTASDQTVGSSTQPVYLDSGSITELTFTANRLYYSAATDSFEATGHYANSTQIFINKIPGANESISENLYVGGATKITGITYITNTTDITTGTNAKDGALVVSGGATISKKLKVGTNASIGGTLGVTGATTLSSTLSVASTSTLTGRVGIGGAPDSATFGDQHILTIHGAFNITDNTKGAHIDFAARTINGTSTDQIEFRPDLAGDGYVGTESYRWAYGYFSELVNIAKGNGSVSLQGTGIATVTDGNSTIELNTIQNNSANQSEITINTGITASSGSIVLHTKNITGGSESQITLTGTDPTILLDSLSGSDWIIHNNAGTFSLNNQAASLVELKGGANGFKLTNRLYINETIPNSGGYALYIGNGNTFSEGNIIPSLDDNDTPINTLGSTNNRWSAVYIGARNTHGDEYTPVYWNAGVPHQVPVVQKYNFEIAAGAASTSISLSNTYRDSAMVTSIVVTSGESYLNAPLTWVIDTTNHAISIVSKFLNSQNNTNVTGGKVQGYVLVSTGLEPSVTQSLAFPSNT